MNFAFNFNSNLKLKKNHFTNTQQNTTSSSHRLFLDGIRGYNHGLAFKTANEMTRSTGQLKPV